MKKFKLLMLFAFLFLFLPHSAKAQVPTFDCSKSIQVYTDVTTGNVYSCKITAGVGTWMLAGGGGGAFGPNFVAGGGTAQAQTVAPTTAVTNATLVNGYQVCWLPIAANMAAAPTLAGGGTSTFTAKPITKVGSGGLTALIANDIVTTAIACAIYDGTEFQLQNPQAGIVVSSSLSIGSGASAAGATATGGFACVEGASTGWTPTAGQDYIRCDSTLHSFVSSSNGLAEALIGGSALSGLTAAAASNTIANGNNPQTWNWAQTADSQNGITFGETSAATGGTLTNGLANQAEQSITTATNSTATPLNVTQGSITNTVATPLAQFRSTWNNSGLHARGFGISITKTASHADSFPLFMNVGNSTLFGVDVSGMTEFNGSGTITTNPPASGLGIGSGWRYALGNNNGGIGTTAVAYIADHGQEYHSLNIGGGSWFALSNAVPSGSVSADSLDTASKFAFSNQVFAMIGLPHSSCGFTALTSQSLFCANSTTGEFSASTNGSTSLGMLIRSQPGGGGTGCTAVGCVFTGQTATKTIYTLCGAVAGACNIAGQYRITWYFNQTGTACGTPAPGQVTFEVSYTDTSGAHSAVALPMNDNSSIAVFTNAFKFAATNVTGFASGEFNIRSTGAQPIQVTNTYTGCAVGTGTWDLTATAERVQ